jgi:type IV secretion system protein VirB6
MACPSVTTGGEFLVRTLAHLDCQAQTLGSFGFQSLAAPGSVAAAVLTALLTLFVAIYGIRLLFGPGDEPRDLINAVLKVGIVLTLAVSWPAWRTLAYDTVLYGPSEVAAAITPATMPGPQAELPRRLQTIDSGIADVTFVGTGRLVNEQFDASTARAFQSVALGDSEGLGWSRPIFLATTIGSLGVLRITGGLLLALAPLFAGLLLFDLTRGLFAGWLRALAFVAVASLGATLLLSVQVAVMEPWLFNVLNLRASGVVTPTAPTEALALVTAFAIAMAGMLFLLARVAFQNAWPWRLPVILRGQAPAALEAALWRPASGGAEIPVHSRALAISESVSATIRRERGDTGWIEPVRRIEMLGRSQPASERSAPGVAVAEPLGSGYRRSTRRETGSQRSRDERG